MKQAVAPGPWLRLTAVFAAAAALISVVSGVLELGAAHHLLSALAVPPLAALVVAAWWEHRPLLPSATAALLLFGVAALVTTEPLHLVAAALAFASALVAAALTFRGRALPNGPWRDYVTLTKPRIMSLLLVTGAGGMFAGARGVPDLEPLTVTIFGLALACGGASALNHVIDRDIDRLMGPRTRMRPVASGRVPAPRALEFGLALSAFSFVLLASTVHLVTALLALAGNVFYVLVYTRWLKRWTPQNIVIGGAAGAVPPLVGWSAATGDVTFAALLLFLIVFVWTPPHFWALALLIEDGYRAARVPMLPVVRGERKTVRMIVGYTALLVGVTLAPFALGMLGVVYLVSAVVLGAVFLWLAERLRRVTTRPRAAALFHFSLAYLALLFVAVAVDPIVA